MASRPNPARYRDTDTMLMLAMLLSLLLHAAAFELLPDHSPAPDKPADQLTVALQPPPPPKPLPPPEPEKPKEPPKKLPPPPKPQPAIQPKAETPPPPVHAAEPPPPPPVMAVAPKPSEPPPAVTVPAPPPEPPPKPVVAPPDIDADLGKYSSLLAGAFAKQCQNQYPRIAQMRGWQGTPKVELEIDAKGSIVSSRIRETSGYEVLNKRALECVSNMPALPHPPETLRGREFTIIVPVTFKLE